MLLYCVLGRNLKLNRVIMMLHGVAHGISELITGYGVRRRLAYALFECSRPRNVCGRFCGATALTETIRWTPINIRMESGGLHAYIEGIITIRLRQSCGSAEPSSDIARARALEKGVR